MEEKLKEIMTNLTTSLENDKEIIAYTGDGEGGICRIEDSPWFDEYLKKELEITVDGKKYWVDFNTMKKEFEWKEEQTLKALRLK